MFYNGSLQAFCHHIRQNEVFFNEKKLLFQAV